MGAQQQWQCGAGTWGASWEEGRWLGEMDGGFGGWEREVDAVVKCGVGFAQAGVLRAGTNLVSRHFLFDFAFCY